MRHVAGASRPYSSIANLASREPSLQTLPFLQQISPRMRTSDFLERVAGAFASWPSALLRTELDRVELAATVRRELFRDDPQGWEAYAAYVRQKVSWFGLELDKITGTFAPTNDPDDDKGGKSERPARRTGWPWEPIG